jgi:hypothetical protein
MKRRFVLLLGLIMALSLVIVPAAAAHGSKHTPAPLPAQIDLPLGFLPEGITSGQASRFGTSTKLYVGSRADGAIWKGSAKTGTGSVLVPGIAGQTALGLHVDWRGRLWVAGGPTRRSASTTPRPGALRTHLPGRGVSTTSSSPGRVCPGPTRPSSSLRSCPGKRKPRPPPVG